SNPSLTIHLAPILKTFGHDPGAMAGTSAPDFSNAWRLFQLNWIPLVLMAFALALGIMVAGFSVEIGGLLFSLGFVAVYAIVAYGNARSPARRDPQVMFVLGSIAQVVLVTVLMAPL